MHQPVQSLDIPKHLVKEIESRGSYCDDHITPENTGLSVYASVIRNAKKLPAPKSALDLYLESAVLGHISTFIAELDAALEGGIPLGQITEFCGEPGNGKTQIWFDIYYFEVTIV